MKSVPHALNEPSYRKETSLMSAILAIDPGLTGAVAIYSSVGEGSLFVYDMPLAGNEVDVHALGVLIAGHSILAAYIERVGPMPRDGVRQAWRFSAAYASVCTLVTLLKLPLHKINPTLWKRGLRIPQTKDVKLRKELSRKRAIELFPDYAALFARKKDSNRAEAALLAYYAHRVHT